MTIAALFVETDGAYFGIEGVDPWDIKRDARNYQGPYSVVAHPPCERWGRYWSGGPSARKRLTLGDDDGCFLSALNSIRKYGGVLEHPEASHAFRIYGLGRPKYGWTNSPDGWGHVCCVEQGHYGHAARKKTWLYASLPQRYISNLVYLPQLIWGPSTGRRLDEGFHSKAERDAARAAGVKPRPRLSTNQNIATPPAFRDVLLGIARSCS